MKKRIRVGNDFDIAWTVKRGGAVEDFTTAVDTKLTMVVYGKTIDNPNFTITGGTLGINVPKELVTTLGDYRLIFEYTLPDARQPDGDLKCQTDVIPFRIVATTAEADVIATIDVASDVAIGLRGDKGLQGDDAYQVWLDAGNIGTLDDYLAWQRQPATDAGNMVVDQTELFLNEQASVLEDRTDLFFEGVQTGTITPIEQAETARAAAETARANAEGDATKGRVKAENERVAAEGERAQAFAQMMGEADDKIGEMDTTLSTYEGRMSQAESDISQLAGDVVLKEATANKQNSLATDGTGTKFPTVDAVNAGLAGVGETLVATYVHSGNLEIAVTAVDLATGVFTAVGHGLVADDTLMFCMNSSLSPDILGKYIPNGLTHSVRLFVVYIDSDHFAVSTTAAGAQLTFTSNATMDLTKWHFEKSSAMFIISNLPEMTKCRVELSGVSINLRYLRPNIVISDNWLGNRDIYGSVNINNYNVWLDGELIFDTTNRVTIKGLMKGLTANTSSANTYKEEEILLVNSQENVRGVTFNSIFNKYNPSIIANGFIIKIYKL